MTLTQITDKLGRRAEHCFYWGSTQWDLPTPEVYQDLIPLVKDPNFKIRPYDSTRKEYESLRKEYESLRKEYEKQRYVFNNQKTHHSVWDCDFDTKVTDIEHPTSKPVALIRTILKYSSNENGIVLDPFIGSGSTLIACEQTNRICYGVEIDPRYCDITIKRWEQYTNQKAEKVASAETATATTE